MLHLLLESCPRDGDSGVLAKSPVVVAELEASSDDDDELFSLVW